MRFLWEPTAFSMCQIHSNTSEENHGIKRTVDQQEQIPSQKDKLVNIKNTQNCIMQVFYIKGLHTDLHCCNWEKSQNSCHKKRG